MNFITVGIILIFAFIFIGPPALNQYERLAADPWWRWPRKRLVRSLIKDVFVTIVGGAIFASIVGIFMLHLTITSPLDIVKWTFGLILIGFILGLPGQIIGYVWYGCVRLLQWRQRLRQSRVSPLSPQ